MQTNIQGKQMDVGDALRARVLEKLEEINGKYFNHATDATVTFAREGHGHGLVKAHVSIRVGRNIMVVADAAENDPYVSFEAASAKVAKQLRRYKRRLRDHHERQERMPEEQALKALDYTLAEDDGIQQGDDPVIIAEMPTLVPTICVSDAVMRMDLSGQTAFLFRNARHGGINMVYRRPDGNVGWVDPAMTAQAAE